LQTIVIIIVFLANVSLVGAGIYLSAYLKRKAEGLATKEEFEDLKKQTAELTRTTKEIEAEISTGIWDRQKRWEMKREVLFDAAKGVSKIENALSNLNSAYVTADKNKSSGQPVVLEMLTKAEEKWFEVRAAFSEVELFVEVTCSNGMGDALGEYGRFTTGIAFQINKGDLEIYKKSLRELIRLRYAVRDAIRVELKSESGSTTLSTVSSATSTAAGPNPVKA
jgi:hypothetical protein